MCTWAVSDTGASSTNLVQKVHQFVLGDDPIPVLVIVREDCHHKNKQTWGVESFQSGLEEYRHHHVNPLPPLPHSTVLDFLPRGPLRLGEFHLATTLHQEVVHLLLIQATIVVGVERIHGLIHNFLQPHPLTLDESLGRGLHKEIV